MLVYSHIDTHTICLLQEYLTDDVTILTDTGDAQFSAMKLKLPEKTGYVLRASSFKTKARQRLSKTFEARSLGTSLAQRSSPKEHQTCHCASCGGQSSVFASVRGWSR